MLLLAVFVGLATPALSQLARQRGWGLWPGPVRLEYSPSEPDDCARGDGRACSTGSSPRAGIRAGAGISDPADNRRGTPARTGNIGAIAGAADLVHEHSASSLGRGELPDLA